MRLPALFLTLTPGEIRHAYDVARKTDDYDKKIGAVSRSGQDPTDTPGDNQIGCVGELAVAKVTGLEWVRIQGKWNAKDVGLIQVRSVRQPDYRLNINDRDAEDDPFVLVWVPEHDRAHPAILGWAWGGEAKFADYIDNPRRRGPKYTKPGGPAFWLPQECLRPFHAEDFVTGEYRPVRRMRAA